MCEIFQCPPDVAERQDAALVERMMFVAAYDQAKRQSETKAADMTPDQIDLFEVVHKWRTIGDEPI